MNTLQKLTIATALTAAFGSAAHAQSINNYAELKVLYVNDGDIAVDAYGNALAAGTAVVRAEAQHLSGNVTWEIVVTGVAGPLTAAAAGNSLAEANFGF